MLLFLRNSRTRIFSSLNAAQVSNDRALLLSSRNEFSPQRCPSDEQTLEYESTRRNPWSTTHPCRMSNARTINGRIRDPLPRTKITTLEGRSRGEGKRYEFLVNTSFSTGERRRPRIPSNTDDILLIGGSCSNSKRVSIIYIYIYIHPDVPSLNDHTPSLDESCTRNTCRKKGMSV